MNMHSLRTTLLSTALVVFSAAPAPSVADYAEIYINTRDLPPEAMPLVMFSLDYRPNLSSTVCQAGECEFLIEAGVLERDPDEMYTFLDMLRASLKLVLQPLSGVRVGLMLNHKDQNNCEGPDGARPGCANGGYIAMGFRELQEGDGNGAKAMFHSVLDTMPEQVDGATTHPYQGRELFFEFYRYLKGMSVYNGMNGFQSYDDGDELTPLGDNNINLVPEYSPLWLLPEPAPSAPIHGFGPDPTIISGQQIVDPDTGSFSNVGIYDSALTTLGDCSKLYTINFMFQVSQQEANSNAKITADIGLPNKCQGPGCDFAQMIEYLNRTDLSDTVEGDQKVTSYFLGAPPQVYNNTFAAYAQAGGTGSALPITENPEELVALLEDIFKQILSVSTTFTSAALPVNTFDRAQVLRDVFLALFQPQVDDYPAANSYWWGNVKTLRLEGEGTADDVLRLVDADGNPAVAADGRIRYDATTFWTDRLGADVADASRDPDENAVDGKDGRSVNRGGGGHKTPGYPRYIDHNPGTANPAAAGVQPEPGPRRIFYDATATSLADLEATDAVAAALQGAIGAVDQAEALQVVKFMRGLDPIATEPEPVPMEWMFGAVMHSRPLIVNYGARGGYTQENPLIYIAAGGNDGALRFILNTDAADPPNELGQEIWSFVPTEVMGNVRQIVRQQGPQFDGESTIYGFDGPATLYVEDHNGDGTIESDPSPDPDTGITPPPDRAIIYAGLRRGGRAYYAIDVSNPEQPDLLWRIVGGETTGFDQLGLAFSQPQTGLMDLDGDGVGEPVVIFSGGYDRQYDEDAGAISNPLGNAIYVVNGLTGELFIRVEHEQMIDSIPSTVAAVDTAGDGLLDRVYVGDLGGRVWRVDMTPSGSPNDWTISRLADLGRHAAGEAPGGQNDRRFFNQPDVVQSRKRFITGDAEATTVQFDAVLLGSGDRENPLYNVPNNWFYMIRDLNTGILTAAEDTVYEMADLTDVTVQTGQDVPIDSAGWKLQMVDVGEKNLSAALTVANVIFFTTYLPPGASGDDVCGPAEGSGRLFTVSLQNANPPRDRSSPIVDSDSDLEHTDRYTDLAAGGIPSEVVFIPPNRVMAGLEEPTAVPITTRWRTFWYLEEDPVQ